MKLILSKNNFKYLLFLMLSLSTFSCKKISCEAFDFEHKTMDWIFFPELNKVYTFLNADSTIITFNQINLDITEFEERRCHRCACSQNLKSTYKSSPNNIVLENYCSYDSEWKEWVGSIEYSVDEIKTTMDFDNNELVEFLYTSEGEKQPAFNISNIANYNLLGTSFENLTQIEILDASKTKIEKIWILEGHGIVGLQINGEKWKKE